MRHADDAKRLPGVEVIEQTTPPIVSSPLLNWPVRANVIVVPGGCVAEGMKNIDGEGSTVKATEAESPPGVPVTVIVAGVETATEMPT